MNPEEISKRAVQFREKKILEMEAKVKRGETLTDIERGILIKWGEIYGQK